MVLAENLLQTKLTLKAEKEYLQKITMKLRGTIIHFDRKPWSFDQGFFGFVGSLKASQARRFKN